VARAAVSRGLSWREATVADVVRETPRASSLIIDVPDWAGHRAGQHVDVRVTAADGYRAQRSYSIASAPEDEHVALTVERLPGGEVSPFLVDGISVGDPVELRGPLGGWFVWDQELGGPLLLVAGGSGIVPLRAILRHRVLCGSDVPVQLLYSARAVDEIIYREELRALEGADGLTILLALTRRWPADWTGRRGRFHQSYLDEVATSALERPLVYVCGPTGFVEAVADGLLDLGHDPDRIRTERFGGTSP
jgi:ferredoxin-NADP reductase